MFLNEDRKPILKICCLSVYWELLSFPMRITNLYPKVIFWVENISQGCLRVKKVGF